MAIIAFTGLKGSGKTAAAKYLQDSWGFSRLSFASGLKDMLKAIGVTEKELTIGKERSCKVLGGKTPRYAMQTLGTEWGRHLIYKDIWIEIMRKKLLGRYKYSDVVIDDCRFANEVELVKELNGAVVRIIRETDTEIDAHASEDISNLYKDHTLNNSTDLRNFECLVRLIAGTL